MTYEYKGWTIDCELFKKVITVLYCGDEIVFDTIEEAKKFIDELEK